MAFIDRETRQVTEPPLPPSPPPERASRADPLPGGVQLALMAFLALTIVASGAALALGRRAGVAEAPVTMRGPDDEHWYPAP